jgi:hypothetical protein
VVRRFRRWHLLKIVIDTNGVTASFALRLVTQVLDHPDGVYEFTGGFRVEVKTTKTQRVFKVAEKGGE